MPGTVDLSECKRLCEYSNNCPGIYYNAEKNKCYLGVPEYGRHIPYGVEILDCRGKRKCTDPQERTTIYNWAHDRCKLVFIFSNLIKIIINNSC